MQRAKYVIIDTGLNDLPVVFPEYTTHLFVAASLLGVTSLAGDESWKDKVLSAGFVEFAPGIPDNTECYGKSTSLGKESRKEDARLIARSLGITELEE